MALSGQTEINLPGAPKSLFVVKNPKYQTEIWNGFEKK